MERRLNRLKCLVDGARNGIVIATVSGNTDTHQIGAASTTGSFGATVAAILSTPAGCRKVPRPPCFMPSRHVAAVTRSRPQLPANVLTLCVYHNDFSRDASLAAGRTLHECIDPRLALRNSGDVTASVKVSYHQLMIFAHVAAEFIHPFSYFLST